MSSTTTSAQLADYVEQLFSSLSPHINDDFDPSKEFISFDDDSGEKKKSADNKNNNNRRHKLNVAGMTTQ